MIVSLPFGDVHTAYTPDETGTYTLYVGFSDLIRLVCSAANTTVTRKLAEERMGYSLTMKKIKNTKFIHINHVLNFIDNVHSETREHTMYVMQSLQSNFKDYL